MPTGLMASASAAAPSAAAATPAMPAAVDAPSRASWMPAVRRCSASVACTSS
ncbi:MAG: hypothetical protein MO847_07860 [Candidatus Protistobacter heckmanni]|nr:hypothetical protein [Candidatus Protistobacter heckmanni]